MITQVPSVIHQPYVSYWGMYKSARVLEAITQYYFPLHELSPQDFFTYYPVLGFVESLIYQADETIEENQTDKQLLSGISPWTKAKKVIMSFLKEQKLDHLLIEKELNNLGEYYQIESQLMQGQYFTHENIVKAAELRSSDARALHAILWRMTNKPFNGTLFEMIWPLEVLADMEDDVHSYQKDIDEEHYNTYRMFVKLYGEEAPQYLKAEMLRYQSIFQEKLELLPKEEQKLYMQIVSAYQQKNSIQVIPEPIME
jgi:hypothetical protein